MRAGIGAENPHRVIDIRGIEGVALAQQSVQLTQQALGQLDLGRITLNRKIETLGVNGHSQGFFDLLKMFIRLTEQEIGQLLIVGAETPVDNSVTQKRVLFWVKLLASS